MTDRRTDCGSISIPKAALDELWTAIDSRDHEYIVEVARRIDKAAAPTESQPVPQDLPRLPPGWVWQWVDWEGNSYDLDDRPPLGGDLCPFAESGPCEGDGACDAVGAWCRAYEAATATECKSVRGKDGE